MKKFHQYYSLSDLSVVICCFYVYNKIVPARFNLTVKETAMDINLVLFKKNGSQEIFSLPSSVTVIGRRGDCDLQIPLMRVSKRHCQLNRDQGVLKVRDLGSRNGTYLNGERINEAVIQPGDYIGVGPIIFVLQIDGQPETVVQPGSLASDRSRQDTPDEQFDSFPELDELDSLEETGLT